MKRGSSLANKIYIIECKSGGDGMNNNRTKVIVAFFIIIILILWNNKYSTNNRLLGYYNADLENFKNVYIEFISSLNNFNESPNIETYSDVQYMFGRTINSLGSLDRRMAVCYRKGLLRNDKLKSEGSEVTVFAARIIKDSRKLINESVELNDSKIILDKSKFKLVYENLDNINDLLEPYYNTIK